MNPTAKQIPTAKQTYNERTQLVEKLMQALTQKLTEHKKSFLDGEEKSYTGDLAVVINSLNHAIDVL